MRRQAEACTHLPRLHLAVLLRVPNCLAVNFGCISSLGGQLRVAVLARDHLGGDRDGIWTHSLAHAERNTCHVKALRSALSLNGVSARPELEGVGHGQCTLSRGASGGEGAEGRDAIFVVPSTRALSPFPVVFEGRNANAGPQL